MNEYGYIKRNFEALTAELSDIASRVGVAVPKLVAVTKSGTDEELIALAEAGASAIGENRPSELVRRAALLSDRGFSPELHQIGTLQSNKAKLVAPISTLIHSLDSESLLRELSRVAERLSVTVPVLIEINCAEEPQKSGVLPRDAERFLERTLEFPRLIPKGLMTMGPVSESPELLRPYFRATKALFDKLDSRYGFGDDPILSMGMSDSYRVAIEEGSTLVRVGRRLFIKNEEDG